MEFKIQTIEKLFSYLVVYAYLLLPLSYLLIKDKKRSIPIVLGLYGVIFFFLLKYFYDVPKNYRLYYQSSYTYLEYLTFAFLLWYNISQKTLKRVIVYLSIAFFVFQVIYLLTQHYRKLDSVPIGIETILIFIYVFFFFYDNFQKTSNTFIYNHYCFWFSVGILVYLGGSFFFYILIEHLNKDQLNTFGTMTYVTDVIKNILFAVGLFIYSRYPIKTYTKKSESIPYLDMI